MCSISECTLIPNICVLVQTFEGTFCFHLKVRLPCLLKFAVRNKKKFSIFVTRRVTAYLKVRKTCIFPHNLNYVPKFPLYGTLFVFSVAFNTLETLLWSSSGRHLGNSDEYFELRNWLLILIHRQVWMTDPIQWSKLTGRRWSARFIHDLTWAESQLSIIQSVIVSFFTLTLWRENPLNSLIIWLLSFLH